MLLRRCYLSTPGADFACRHTIYTEFNPAGKPKRLFQTQMTGPANRV